MSTVKERILEFIKDSQMSVAEFERRIEVSNGYVNSISKSIQPDKLEKISKSFPDLNINWLLLGTGAMKRGTIIGIDISSVIDNTNSTLALDSCIGQIEIPEAAKEIVEKIWQAGLKSTPKYLDENKLVESLKVAPDLITKEKTKAQTRPRIPYTAAAGSLTSAVNGITEADCEQIPVITAFPTYDYTMIVKGDSMYPNYEGGDEVACKRIDSTSFIQWGKVHVLDTAQGIVIKRIYDDNGNIRCVSYNKEYPDFTISKEEVYSISLVVGMLRL